MEAVLSIARMIHGKTGLFQAHPDKIGDFLVIFDQ
jgi:hypothetical protein